MLAFSHNEDHYRDTDLHQPCSFKCVGVRYSFNLSRSWTRSSSIPTIGIQLATSKCPREGGVGNMAAAWNHYRIQWTLLSQEAGGPLSMSVSSCPTATPGSFTSIDPPTGRTSPGLRGSPLPHSDLRYIPGSNPSILHETKNQCWHLVYGRWGEGIAYSKSVDLERWEKPRIIYDGGGECEVSTLVGDRGDVEMTSGEAMLYFRSYFVVGKGVLG